MKTLKTTVVSLLVALLAAMLAACGNAPAATSPTAAPAAGGSGQAATSAPAANSGSKAKVTVMTWEGADTNAAIDEALKTFMAANPEIEVERVPSPNSGYSDKLNAMVQAKQLPDIFWAGNDTAQQFGGQGLLFDWTEYAQKSEGGFSLSAFAPGAIENWTSADGKLYGLPTLMNTYGIWYNADLFQQAGVPLPKPGWTYDDMLKAATALTQKDGSTVKRYGVYAVGNESLQSPFTISNCAVSAGGQPFMDRVINPTKVTADEKFVACAKQIAEAVQSGAITPTGYPSDGLTESFIAGQIPMLFFGQWLVPSFLEAQPSFKYGFA
nr:extracellular solute-binding protein [Chloroflexaceae bacterium]